MCKKKTRLGLKTPRNIEPWINLDELDRFVKHFETRHRMDRLRSRYNRCSVCLVVCFICGSVTKNLG